MKRQIIAWVEHYLYTPSLGERLLSYTLLPVTLLYCLIVWIRYKTARFQTFDEMPVISVGNLTVGGSGKTPLVCALAQSFTLPCIVLRGYGRKSSGLIVVKDTKAIRCSVHESGDEAMLYAQKLPSAVVIVSEKREDAISQALKMGCEVVLLDDGYSQHHIKKYDILIPVETSNTFCLPSGPFREQLWNNKKVYLAQEGESFKRRVVYKELTDVMVLVTAIARPQRLEKFLPSGVIARHYFPDHHYFTKQELEMILEQSGATSLLVTYKDYVKMAPFNLPLSLMDLELEVADELLKNVHTYVNDLKVCNPDHKHW